MKIFHSKAFQHIQVDNIDYSQYDQICDAIFTYMPNLIISTQYRKNLLTGFFVLMNQAITNKVLELFAHPPASLTPSTEATKEAKKELAKKSTKAKEDDKK
jgi:hypothetical protein